MAGTVREIIRDNFIEAALAADSVMYSLIFMDEMFSVLSMRNKCSDIVLSPEGMCGVSEIMNLLAEKTKIISKAIYDIEYSSEIIPEVHHE
jgi:hypothetical protein